MVYSNCLVVGVAADQTMGSSRYQWYVYSPVCCYISIFSFCISVLAPSFCVIIVYLGLSLTCASGPLDSIKDIGKWAMYTIIYKLTC